MSEFINLQVKWYYRYPWTRILMFAYCVGCACVGLVGFAEYPSQALVITMGMWAALVYSGVLIICGLIGAAGIFRSFKATVISVWTIAAGTFFHGLAIMGTSGGLQTGLRLAVAPLMMVPLVWTWWQWLTLVLHVQDGDWRLPKWWKRS